MQHRLSALFVVAAIAMTGGLALACQDSQRTTAPPIQPPSTAIGAERRPERPNQFSWVGSAHNAALDAFRTELVKPEMRRLDVCSFILAFASSDARIPKGRAAPNGSLSLKGRRAAATKALSETKLCGRRSANLRSETTSPVQLVSYWSRSASPVPERAHLQSAQPSAAAYALYAQIETALDAATNSVDLAARLSPVLSSAAQLSQVEYAAVAATASVAQSSFEYWEPQFPPYVQQVEGTFGPCIDESYAAGYTLDGILYRCTNGGGVSVVVPASGRGWAGTARPLHLVTLWKHPRLTRARQCGYYCQGFREIGKQDARGAFVGAWAGVLAGGPQGAVLGAIAGGSGASMAAAIGLAFGAIVSSRYR